MSEPIDITPEEAKAPLPPPVTKAEVSEITAAMRTLTEATRKSQEAAESGMRKMLMICAGAMTGAVIAAALTGLVAMRTVADLREASQIQAASGKIALEQMTAFRDVLTKSGEAQDALRSELATIVAEMELSMQDSLAEMATAPPDFSALTTYFDAQLKKLREEIMVALAELSLASETSNQQGSLANPSEVEKLAALAPAPKPEAAPQPKPKTETKPAPQKPKPSRGGSAKVDNGAFAYP